jgi:hypothetical protein
MVGRLFFQKEVKGSNPLVYIKLKDYFGNMLKVLKAAHLGECSARKPEKRKCLFRENT